MVSDNSKTKKTDMMWRYVIFAYLLFWIMVMALGGTAAMVLHLSPVAQRIVQAFCAWAPTLALLIMFRKLRPDTKFRDFLVSSFNRKPRIDLLLVSGLTVAVCSLLPLLILSFFNNQDFTSYFSLQGYSLPSAIVLSLFAGPLGEELGWRGYLRVELDKKYSFLKASIIGGVIWAFWHAILWFVDIVFLGGATGWPLAAFIISNIVGMTSLVIIMNVVLKRSNNLIHAIWIHFCFNIIYVSLTTIDVWYFVLLTVTYGIAGVAFLLFQYGYFPKKTQFSGKVLRGSLLLLVMSGGLTWTVQAQTAETMIAPLGQYQYLEMGRVDIHSSGGGLLLLRKNENSILSVMGFYTRHTLSEKLIENGSDTFHKISGVMNWEHKNHEVVVIVKSESDNPFAGGLRTCNVGAAYGRTWFEGQHYSLLLGGGVVVGEFGDLPAIPIPFIRYNLNYSLFETVFEFMTGPSLTFKVAPHNRFYGVAEFSQEEFRNIRDLKFDVYAGYRIFNAAGFNLGVKNQSLNFDNSRAEEDLDISAYVAYGQLDFEIVQVTGGYAFSGQALKGNEHTGKLGDGPFFSIIGMIPLGF